MANLNLAKAYLAGRLTTEPEVKLTTGGTPVCRFSIAVNKRTTGTEKKVCFFNCIAIGDKGTHIQRYFRKGNSIFVEASPEQRQWRDNTGALRSAVEFMVNSVEFVDSKNEAQSTAYQEGAAPGAPYGGNGQASSDGMVPLEDEDDLPF